MHWPWQNKQLSRECPSLDWRLSFSRFHATVLAKDTKTDNVSGAYTTGGEAYTAQVPVYDYSGQFGGFTNATRHKPTKHHSYSYTTVTSTLKVRVEETGKVQSQQYVNREVPIKGGDRAHVISFHAQGNMVTNAYRIDHGNGQAEEWIDNQLVKFIRDPFGRKRTYGIPNLKTFGSVYDRYWAEADRIGEKRGASILLLLVGAALAYFEFTRVFGIALLALAILRLIFWRSVWVTKRPALAGYSAMANDFVDLISEMHEKPYKQCLPREKFSVKEGKLGAGARVAAVMIWAIYGYFAFLVIRFGQGVYERFAG